MSPGLKRGVLNSHMCWYVIVLCIYVCVYRCAESAAESERGKIEEVEKELSESKGQLREVEDKVQSLELRVTKSSQLNSELQTELQ